MEEKKEPKVIFIDENGKQYKYKHFALAGFDGDKVGTHYNVNAFEGAYGIAALDTYLKKQMSRLQEEK